MNTQARTIGVVSIFCMAMAALESAVVVYLRALYYPGEFTVALKVIDQRILLTEITREAATIIMLWAIGFLAGKNSRERFAYFLLSFAVWDIFYYVWLKAFINWPLSIFDWDILFLIPITWLGPVAAPVICSITMVVLSFVLLRSEGTIRISKTVWTLLLVGSLTILFTFLKDYGNLMIDRGFLKDYAHLLDNPDFLAIASTYIPETYSWSVFWIGELLIIAGIVKVYLEMSKENRVLSIESRQ